MSIFSFKVPSGSFGGGGSGSGSFPVVSITATNFNLVVTDNLTFFVMDSVPSQTITIPANAAEAFPIGAEMAFIREGIGIVAFIVSGAAVLHSRDGLNIINTRYSAVSLKKIDTDEWRLIGDLT